MSADETKKYALAEASLKARQLKSDRKRARAEIARFLRQKKREKADKKVVKEEVETDGKEEEEEEVKRQTRSRFKIEDAKQKSKFNEPKAAENVEKPEKMVLIRHLIGSSVIGTFSEIACKTNARSVGEETR